MIFFYFQKCLGGDGGGNDDRGGEGMGVERPASAEGGVLTDGEGGVPESQASNVSPLLLNKSLNFN